jgi:leucyl-tRNA synthetase
VNGKLRDRITLPASYEEDEVKESALKSERTRRFIEGKKIERLVYVPQKLVNIVCR